MGGAPRERQHRGAGRSGRAVVALGGAGLLLASACGASEGGAGEDAVLSVEETSANLLRVTLRDEDLVDEGAAEVTVHLASTSDSVGADFVLPWAEDAGLFAREPIRLSVSKATSPAVPRLLAADGDTVTVTYAEKAPAGERRAQLVFAAKPVLEVIHFVNGQGSITLTHVTEGAVAHDFGEVLVGQVTPDKKFTIGNGGEAPLLLESITGPEAPFVGAAGAALPRELAPAESVELAVSFAPEAAGAHQGTITVAAGTLSLTFQVAGTGL